LIGAEYIIKVIFPERTDTQNIQVTLAISCILLFYAVNLLGLKMSARTQNVLTIIKIVMIILLVTPLFFASHIHQNDVAAPMIKPTLMQYIKAFGLGLVAVSFTYGGYQQTINFGEEINNPAKNIPRSIFMGIIIILVLYLGINYAYVKIIGFENLKVSGNIAAIMASHVFGNAAGNILSVFLFLCVMAYVNGTLLSNPRVMQAMSEERVLPAAFARRTNKTNVLLISLSVFTSLCTLIVFWAKTFDTILSFSVFLDSFGMVLSAATIFVLRKRTVHLDNTGTYKMKLYPLMPLLFMATYSFVAISIFIDKPYMGLTGFAILAGFIGLYFLLYRKTKQKNSAEKKQSVVA
jgi:APA family basic amino acid/polyamine antiporter